jgi:hypothetical protein
MADLDIVKEEDITRRLREAVVMLVRDEDFARVVTYSTNSTISVQERFAAMEDAVCSVVSR